MNNVHNKFIISNLSFSKIVIRNMKNILTYLDLCYLEPTLKQVTRKLKISFLMYNVCIFKCTIKLDELLCLLDV